MEPLALLTSLGFGAPLPVQGRGSIADLLRPHQRCGIYVLRFADDALYAGQALDVARRYVDHRRRYPDISHLMFKPVIRSRLNDVERDVVAQLERAGRSLRNVLLTSLPNGESDFDDLMTVDEQERWLNATAATTATPAPEERADRPVAEDQRRRHAHRFTQLQAMAHVDEAIEGLHHFVTQTIPAVRRSEMSFWSASCLPRPTVFSRISLYWQEVCTAFTYEGEVWFTIHLARSPLEDTFGPSFATTLATRYPGVTHDHHIYEPGGPDQTCFVLAGPGWLHRFLTNPAVQRACRLFNLRLMKKAACIYARYHCPELADRILAQHAPSAPRSLGERPGPTLYAALPGFNRRPDFHLLADRWNQIG